MKIYLASPLFTEEERQNIRAVASCLRSFGNEVYVPMENQIDKGWDLPNCEWASKVFEEDVQQINECDKVIGLYYGLYSDSGTAWELGYAYALNKPVHVMNMVKGDVSLMVAQSCDNWKDFQNVNQT